MFLFLIFFVGVVATSIWVFTDAKARIAAGEHLEPIESAAGWAWGCILLWIVFFPWYLMRKSNSTVTTKPTLTRIVEQVVTPLNRDDPKPPSVADEIAKFGELREKGLISNEDFELQRAKLLGRPAENIPPKGGDCVETSQPPKSPTLVTCASCGKLVGSSDDAFCRNCGAPV